MSGPFPGMDPWLENAHTWQGVHNTFIVYAAEALQELIRPRFVASVEVRVFISTVGRNIVPDVLLRRGRGESPRGSSPALLEPDEALVLEHVDDEVREAYIEIIDLETNQEVVTVIEVLSPSNKFEGEGHDLYRAKQQEVLQSSANLVEIDLLRGGPHVLAVPQSEIMPFGTYDYLVAISRSWDRAQRSFLYVRNIRERLPRIAVPLRSTVPAATLDLQSVLDRVYETGAFADRLNYSKPCVPRLHSDDEAWAQERIRNWQASRSN